MKPLQKLLNKCNGLHYPQEYLCFAAESFEQPLRAYLVINHVIEKDITHLHAFVGYSPLIIALSSSVFESVRMHNWQQAIDNNPLPVANCLLSIDQLRIVFTAEPLSLNGIFKQKDAIAWLDLRKFCEQKSDNGSILFFEGQKGHHHFLSGFHQFINGLNNRLFNKKPGNVFLGGNLYKQVQIAYALPRYISLITVSQQGLFNLFPTDLHGQPGPGQYLISLRQNGKACQQVEQAGKILVSRMQVEAYKTVYSLGKNHMQELKPIDHFPFSGNLSPSFQLPLPDKALAWHELELQDSFVHGIHKLLLFRLHARGEINRAPLTLAHIHNSYASWRYKQRLPGNYLLR